MGRHHLGVQGLIPTNPITLNKLYIHSLTTVVVQKTINRSNL